MKFAYTPGMFWKLFLPFAFLLVLSSIAAALFLPSIIQGNAEREAVTAGEDTVRQYKALRTYYTENVVAKVLAGTALQASYAHQGDPTALPLPA